MAADPELQVAAQDDRLAAHKSGAKRSWVKRTRHLETPVDFV